MEQFGGQVPSTFRDDGDRHGSPPELPVPGGWRPARRTRVAVDGVVGNSDPVVHRRWIVGGVSRTLRTSTWGQPGMSLTGGCGKVHACLTHTPLPLGVRSSAFRPLGSGAELCVRTCGWRHY